MRPNKNGLRIVVPFFFFKELKDLFRVVSLSDVLKWELDVWLF